MPNVYKRKQGARPRGEWTEANLQEAVNAVNAGVMGITEASSSFDVPKTTLLRRIRNNNFKKRTRLGPDSCLGEEAEREIALHIKKLQKNGFAPTRDEVRIMAYKLAEKMQIEHKFNKEHEKAGYRWLQSFMRRNPDIVIRKGENVSAARAVAMSKDLVKGYYNLLNRILTENDLHDKPGNVYNADETGLQLNTRAGNVLAEKGSKSVPLISSGEKGETISVLACCNAEGVFIPPFSIFKGKNKKDEFLDGMPPGSAISMSEKSAYVNSDIFFHWLQTHFVPRKMPGKVLLILDGHTSHTTNLEMLEYATQNDIILLCLPAHTTHYLQPLDHAFVKSLKTHYYNACNRFVKCNASRKLSRLQFGKLLGESWNKAATVENAVSAFRSTGIAPFNPFVPPDYAFIHNPMPNAAEDIPQEQIINAIDQAEASTSRTPVEEELADKEETPGKMLNAISPITETVVKVRKRATGVAAVLNLIENIEKRKQINESKQEKEKRKMQKITTKKQTGKAKGKRKRAPSFDTESEEEEEVVLNDAEETEDELEDYENECAGCKEDYRLTKKKEDWIKCLICGRWLHEGCTSFANLCLLCGKHSARKK